MLEKRREEEMREKRKRGEGKGGEERRIRPGEGREAEERKQKRRKHSEALRSRLPPRSQPSADHTDESRAEDLPSQRVYRQKTKGCFRGF